MLSLYGSHLSYLKYNVYEKITIRNRYSQFSHRAPDNKRKRKHKQLRQYEVKQHKRRAKRTTHSQQMATRLNKSTMNQRQTVLRSYVINLCVCVYFDVCCAPTTHRIGGNLERQTAIDERGSIIQSTFYGMSI